MRQIMDLWLQSEIRTRRDAALETSRACRLACLAQDGRSTGIRIRVADSAQAISNVLAALASSLRDGEAA
jgi:hypothetical protein